jgi:hypothetical protein
VHICLIWHIELVQAADAALDRVTDRLPRGFPERVVAKISAGVRGQAKRFASEV